jgi:hypothetical protein
MCYSFKLLIDAFIYNLLEGSFPFDPSLTPIPSHVPRIPGHHNEDDHATQHPYRCRERLLGLIDGVTLTGMRLTSDHDHVLTSNAPGELPLACPNLVHDSEVGTAGRVQHIALRQSCMM